jgi:GTP diphosphokinase / guanosine-3',5'-bis(diphosphate) 3'-diphosphatase
VATAVIKTSTPDSTPPEFVSMAQRPDSRRVASIKTLIALCDYLSPDDIKRLREAYRVSDEAHLGQLRTSGEPYISHPIAVAEICARWRLDADALMAALLHDVVEDCGVSLNILMQKFGPNVSALVDGLSKLDRAEFASREIAQAENFRKMLLAMSRDVRVILIKLADRLHNVQTLEAVQPEKRRRVASETLSIYAPIADRLGLHELYRELVDRSFSHQNPHRFAVLEKAVHAQKRSSRKLFARILEGVERELLKFGITAKIQSREKTIYGIYRKMRTKRQAFASVMDVYAFRLVVDTTAECYVALGAVHSAFRPISERFKDYVANPKTNGYQSLHSTVVGPHSMPVEFQIRTKEMHRTAEAGVASHWLYKARNESFSELQTRTHQWLQGLLDIQNNTNDSLEFLENVKVDLFPDAIYVFTPKGLIRALPKHATVLDFAYSIHTDIGQKAYTAKINGHETPLRTELSHGDVVEIITSDQSQPNATWLSFVRTGKARAEIRHYLRTTQLSESIEFGRQLLEQALASIRIDAAHIDSSVLERAVQDAGAQGVDDLYAEIGLGKILPQIVARAIARQINPDADKLAESMRALPVVIRGSEGMTVQCAKCCFPVPGDEILGFMKGGHGLTLHRQDCSTAERQKDKDAERQVNTAWSRDVVGAFQCKIEAFVSNESGLLSRVTGELASADSNIVDLQIDQETHGCATLRFLVEVKNRQHIARLLRILRRVPGVRSIRRA